jgi:hypothetical protein
VALTSTRFQIDLRQGCRSFLRFTGAQVGKEGRVSELKNSGF